MPAGTVVFFDLRRRFGFITPTDGGDDIFVHLSSVEHSGLASISKGDFLEFDVEFDRRTRKFVATNLEVVTPASG